MARSMTGFGAATAEASGESLSVEVRTVNHRFCDVKVRGSRDLAGLEAALAAKVRSRLDRGSVDLTVRRTVAPDAAGRLRLDVPLARAYADRLRELGEALGLDARPGLMEIAALEGVVTLEEAPVDLERLEALAARALDEALDQVIAMRDREGAALAADILERIDRVRSLVSQVEAAAPAVVEASRDRMIERVGALAEGVEVDPQRIALEIAVLAERADVAEELTRLSSHLDQFAELLGAEGAVGRKLDFLMQEMNREVNTIGSKSQSTDIAGHVVDLKAELERIREQVQNVE